MGHREDLLEGAKRCLYEKGYARTTARDIVAASGTNLGSIGYHYGSTRALMNAALMDAIDEFGQQIAQAMADDDPTAEPIERFERYWERLIESIDRHRPVWAATFEVVPQIDHAPQVRRALAEGLQEGRMMWAKLLLGIDPAVDERKAQVVGSFYQALLSGVLAQWLIDPEHAPSARDLADALRTIAAAVS